MKLMGSHQTMKKSNPKWPKTTKSYTTGDGIFEKDNVTEGQKILREAWLKG